jgi:hypothetical protein
MKVCVCPAADPHKVSHPNLAWAPHFTRARHQARGQPQMLDPGPPTAPPTARPLLLLSYLDQSAQDYFTIVL